jgi:hypothetical protein
VSVAPTISNASAKLLGRLSDVGPDDDDPDTPEGVVVVVPPLGPELVDTLSSIVIRSYIR